MTGVSVYIMIQIVYMRQYTNFEWFMEVEIMTRASICLADTVVLSATWYTTGSVLRLARRTETAHMVSLTIRLLIDGAHRCHEIVFVCLKLDFTLGTAYSW